MHLHVQTNAGGGSQSRSFVSRQRAARRVAIVWLCSEYRGWTGCVFESVQARFMRNTLFIAGALALVSTSCVSSTSATAVPATAVRRDAASEYCLTAQCIYVTNGHGPAIDIYSTDAHGESKPIARIKGPSTGLTGPEAVAVDANHNVYVADTNGSYKASIKVYPAGKYGNIAPTQTITGPATQLAVPNGIAVDSVGNMYVANFIAGTPCTGSITEYPAGSSGDAAPIAQIEGKKTRLCRPWGTALDASGNIYVTSGQQYSSAVYVYASGSNGNVPPIARISGSRTQLYDSTGIALNATGDIYVTSGDSLLKFRTGAHGNAKPVQSINGLRTKLQFPYSTAVDARNEIYTVDGVPRAVLAFASHANGDVRPIRVIRGNTRVLFHIFWLAIR